MNILQMRCKFINGQATRYDASYVSHKSSMSIKFFSFNHNKIIIDNNNNKN